MATEQTTEDERRRIREKKWIKKEGRSESESKVSGTTVCSFLPVTSCSALSTSWNPWRMKDVGSGGIKKKRMRWEKGELEKEKVTGVS